MFIYETYVWHLFASTTETASLHQLYIDLYSLSFPFSLSLLADQ